MSLRSEEMAHFLYQEAKEKIIHMIETGEFKPNEKIMTERQLAEMLQYKRMTIKKAVDSLVEDGVLIKKRGAGTYLVEREHSKRFEIGDDSPLSLTQSIRIKGMTSSSFVESFKLIYNDEKLMKIFSDYFEFYELVRVREADGEAVSIQKAYFPFRLFKDAHRYDFTHLSLYDYMDYKSKKPVHLKKRLKAYRVNEDPLFDYLHAKEGEYVLCFEYFGYTENNELVEYTQSFFETSKINFKMDMDYYVVP
jgi:GntR family transcriptional regulator